MRFHTHSSGLRTSRQVERKILNNVIFTKLKVDTSGITDDELVEPFDALVSAGRHYIHHGALPPTRQSAHRPDTAPSSPRRDHGLPPDHTTVLSGRSSSKTTYVPPAGFEPALPPPEAGSLRALRRPPVSYQGLSRVSRVRGVLRVSVVHPTSHPTNPDASGRCPWPSPFSRT